MIISVRTEEVRTPSEFEESVKSASLAPVKFTVIGGGEEMVLEVDR